MRALIRTTTAIGVTEVALVFVAIVRNKYLAVSIRAGRAWHLRIAA